MPVEVQAIQQAYKYALDPTPRQARMLASHAGGARFAYNWGNARIIEALDARGEEKENLGEAKTKVPSHFDLCKEWTAWKDQHADDPEPAEGERRTNTAWVAENFVGSYQAALRDAAKAWSDFFKSAQGKRKGRRLGRPRFKKRGRARDSFQVHGGTLRVIGADGDALGFRARHADVGSTRYMVILPKIGPVFLHESARKLRRRVDKGLARIVRGTVSRDSDGRWHIAITVELQREIRTGPSKRQRAGGVVGIDFGVRDIATLSDGSTVPNPRHLEQLLGRLARAQRPVARRKDGSQKRRKAVALVGKLHARAKHLRLDALHKATSQLVQSRAVIAVEGFDVQETARYRHRGKIDRRKASASQKVPAAVRRNRNRALADTGIGIARWQLQSKGAWYGSQVLVMDKHAPTGRTCSACGTAKAKPVPPADEMFTCEACGVQLPRRVNTARSLELRARAAVHDVAPSTGETLNARGGDVRPAAARRGGRPPSKREASTRPPGRGEPGSPGG
ncbi:MAG: RNA-guided endonuclease InsQ/TnpB family protein [Streptosporangiaceae bacterium]